MAKKSANILDVVIVGGGIAAHTAAIYSGRADLHPVVISAGELDQLSLTSIVENWPGYAQGVMGPELIENAKKQAQKFGARYIVGRVDSFKSFKGGYELGVGKTRYLAKTVIISTGAAARTLDVPGKDKYFGRGVSTCAVCDAALYRNKQVVIIGGGDSAMEDSLALSKFANKITVIHRRNKFRASKIMQKRVFELSNKIAINFGASLTEIIGDGKFVTGVKIKNLKTGKQTEIKCDGVFFAIGHNPATQIFAKEVKIDKQGFIKTDKNQHTNLPGVFAAGDCQDYIYSQAITSAGSGCQAALEAEWYLEEQKSKGKH